MDKPAPKVKEASMGKEDTDRAARLAEALRTNLRRRKAQARAVEAEPQPSPAADVRESDAPPR